jgi:hypothetical protein
VRKGVASTAWVDNFAYAEDFDAEKGRYIELKAGTGINPSISSQGLLVKPEVARQELDEEESTEQRGEGSEESKTTSDGHLIADPNPLPPPAADLPKHRRFFGSVNLEATRINRDCSVIVNEVIQYLIALDGADVKVTLEIEADIPDGVPDHIERTVMENCRTLKFKNQSFEIS